MGSATISGVRAGGADSSPASRIGMRLSRELASGSRAFRPVNLPPFALGNFLEIGIWVYRDRTSGSLQHLEIMDRVSQNDIHGTADDFANGRRFGWAAGHAN